MGQTVENQHGVGARVTGRLAAVMLENVFNPYRDDCPTHDGPNASALRRANLARYLDAAGALAPRTAWIGRDLGWRGGRRTGLPLTDEMHLDDLRLCFGTAPLRKATRTPALAERTAAEIWRLVRDLDHPPFLWNAFPLHPHLHPDGDAPLGNRRHRRAEFDAVADILETLLGAFAFERIFALGADASAALTRLGVAHARVRHPSFGGHAEFRQRMRQEYSAWRMLL